MFKPHSTVVMTGDSITDGQRDRPVGRMGGLGKCYPMFFDAMLQAHCPEDEIRILNTGCDGNRSRQLLERFDSDVLAYKPDYITVLIGVNDVWRQFDRPLFSEDHGLLGAYKENVELMAEKSEKAGAEMILLLPFMFEPNREEPMRKAIEQYAHAAGEIARERGIKAIPLQPCVDDMLKHRHPMSITWDRVHPNYVAHYRIAYEIAKALQYPFAQG